MQIDIAKLNELFGMQVDLCRYCKGKCTLSMQKCDLGGTYPCSECPKCKQTMRGYQGMFWVWKEKKSFPSGSGFGRRATNRKRGKK